MLNIQFLHSQIRKEEKLLLKELEKRDINIIKSDVRKLNYNIKDFSLPDIDLAIERSISYFHGLNAVRIIENEDIRCINNSEVISICGDKLQTSLVLHKSKIPQPDVYLAQSIETALEIINRIGYPVVIKPLIGSWGRMLAKINDQDSAEAILEYRSRMGFLHSAHYIQQFVNKSGRDIRTFVVGDQCIAAIYRYSDHWITNTARGGKAVNCHLTDEIVEISINAASAVTNGKLDGIIALDILESDNRLLINEVNATMEFKNSIHTTDVNIPVKIVDFIIDQLRR